MALSDLVPNLGAPPLVALVYLTVSGVLFFFPGLLHKRKRRSHHRRHNFVVISHRGGAGERVENTLQAFEYSKKIGVDIVEFDCHLTKDGKVVVCHDDHLLRLTGVDTKISDLNYDELPSLLQDTFEHDEENAAIEENVEILNEIPRDEIQRNIHHRNSLTSSPSTPSLTHSSTRIPLLAEVFQLLPDMPINLDIKIHNDELIQKVNDLIVEHKREHITVWGSFHDSVLQKCLKVNPHVDAYFSKLGVFRILLSMLSASLPFIPFRESYVEIIMPDIHLKKWGRRLPLPMFMGLWLVKIFFMRRALIRHLRKRGILTYYWVLNTEAEFRTAIELGVDGIITDYPKKLIKFINDNYSDTLVRPRN